MTYSNRVYLHSYHSSFIHYFNIIFIQYKNTLFAIFFSLLSTPDSHLDHIAFFVTISKLSESNHFDTICQFLNDLLTSRPDLKMEHFASLAIVLYCQAKMIPQAIDTFKRIHHLSIPRTIKSLNALLFACLLAKDYKELNQVYIEFPKFNEIQPIYLRVAAIIVGGFNLVAQCSGQRHRSCCLGH